MVAGADKPVTMRIFRGEMRNVYSAIRKLDEKFVTKGEFHAAMDQINNRFEQIDNRFNEADKRADEMATKKWVIENMVSKGEFREFKDWVIENMYTKQDHAKYMEYFDEAMTELRDMRDERKLKEHQISRMDDTIVDHEKRIRVLEKR